MRKKGFTLIELLAVIVILAIIALIATPMIMDVIEKARQGAAKESARGYVHGVETEIMTSTILDATETITGKYTLDENRNLVGSTSIKVEVKGEKPSGGTICINSKGQVSSYSLKVGKYYVTSNDGKNQEFTDELQELDCSGNNITTSNVYANGTPIYFNPALGQVCMKEEAESNVDEDGAIINKDGCIKWYAFNDSETATTVSVLMGYESSMAENPKFYPNYAEIMNSATNQLSEYTKEWQVKLDPRLITAYEIARIDGNTEWSASNSSSICLDKNDYDWLARCSILTSTEHEDYDNNGVDEYIWVLNFFSGCLRVADDTSEMYWILPVITIDKSILK